MEDPSSPMTSHMLSAQMQPAFSHAAAGSLASSYPPDACLLPNNAMPSRSLGSSGLLRPRHGFLPPALQQTDIEACSSLKENQIRNEDDFDAMQQCAAASMNNNSSLQVDYHVFSPPSVWKHQPVTPSPPSSSTLHDNISGWRAPNVGLQKISSSNGIGPEGKRIGFDGTSQTPSAQLLKPTASSLGHRFHKASASARPKHLLPLPPGALQSSTGHKYQDTGGHLTNITYHTLASCPIDPFGKLNKSSHSNIATSDEDDDMASTGQSSTSLLENFDFDEEPTEEGRMDDRQWLLNTSGDSAGSNLPGHFNLPKLSLSRCSSWSPGLGYNEGLNSGRSCPQRLRTMAIDPVASQLLRACAVHEEEEEGQEDHDFLSMSSHAIGRAPESSDAYAGCRSPIRPSSSVDNRNFYWSASMPDLHSPIPHVSEEDRVGKNYSRTISEDEPINYPMSPVPLRDASDNIRDAKADGIRFLARPVPRKLSIPMIAGSPSSRRASFSSFPGQS